MLSKDEILKDPKFLWRMILDSRKTAPKFWSLHDKLVSNSPRSVQYGYPESSPSLQYWFPAFDDDRPEYDAAIDEAIETYLQNNNDVPIGKIASAIKDRWQ